jgi:hypothetical protein
LPAKALHDLFLDFWLRAMFPVLDRLVQQRPHDLVGVRLVLVANAPAARTSLHSSVIRGLLLTLCRRKADSNM